MDWSKNMQYPFIFHEAFKDITFKTAQCEIPSLETYKI